MIKRGQIKKIILKETREEHSRLRGTIYNWLCDMLFHLPMGEEDKQ